MGKQWYQSKTIRMALLQGLIGIVIALLGTEQFAQYFGVLTIIKSALDIALRVNTDQAIVPTPVE